MTHITHPPQVGLLIYSHRGVVEVEVYADPQDARATYHRWWAEQGIDPDDIEDAKSNRHDGESLDWMVAPVENSAGQHTTDDQSPAQAKEVGPIHWLRCDHPLCFARWEGTSIEATFDEHLDEYLCPACGGASAVRDRGLVPESVLKFARVTRDAFYDPIDRIWEDAAQDLPLADLHRVIVHTALACGQRLPVQVILDHQRAAEEAGTQRLASIFTVKSEFGTSKLRITKVASTPYARPGEEVDFTLRFDNVGTEVIGNVTVIDNLTTRLEYVPDSAKCSVPAEFFTEHNEGDSLALRWEITDPVSPGEGGVIRFRCLVR